MKSCRICLNTCDEKNRVGIFSKIPIVGDDEMTIGKMFTECSSIQIHHSDLLPKTICRECTVYLCVCHDFRTQIIKSDIQLRSNLSTSVKSEPSDCLLTHEVVQISDIIDITKLKANIKQKINSAIKLGLKKFCLDNGHSTVSNIVSTTIDEEEKPVENPIEKNVPSQATVLDESDKPTEGIKIIFDEITPSLNDETKSSSEDEAEDFDTSSVRDLETETGLPVKSEDEDDEESNPDKESIEESETKNQNKDGENSTDDSLSNIKEYIKLLDNAEGRKKFACKECNKLFDRPARLEWHVRNKHTGVKPHICDVCKKGFASAWSLKVHQTIHTGVKPYSCEICGKNFRGSGTLKAHVKTHSELRSYKCSLCDKAFKQEACLKNHETVHSIEKSFSCEKCGKLYKTQSSLLHHQETHREKAVACPLCGKLFVKTSYMRVHLKTHSGEKPYACEICNKNFSTRYVLKQHKNIHTGVKPYSCNICQKKFTFDVLARHMRTHTGETPYICALCSKKFAFSHHLMNHMKRYHPESR